MQSYTENLLSRLSTFNFTEISVSCKFTAPASLPEFKGSTFHGGFGWALEAVSPALMAALYSPKDARGHTLPKPFVLIPPYSRKREYAVGEQFTFTLKVMLSACQYLDDICASLFLWQELGLGQQRAGFSIQYIDMLMPDVPVRVFQRGMNNLAMPSALPLSTYLEHAKLFSEQVANCKVQVFCEFPLPVQLEKERKAYKQAPSLRQLNWFITHRAAGLLAAFAYSVEDDINKHLPEESDKLPVCIQQHQFSQDRFSKTQQREHNLSGFTGTWCYNLSTPASFVLMKLAEKIHLGKKTSFGFGQLKVIPAILT